MSKYYKITDAELVKKVEDWFAKRKNAEKAFLRLSRRVGASRTRFASGDSFGRRSFAFVFNKEPDRELWKLDRSKDFWLPKRGSKEGKKIAEEVEAIQQSDGSRNGLSKLFEVENFFHRVGIDRIGETWIVVFGDDWKYSTKGLKRVSDVQVEKMRAKEKKC